MITMALKYLAVALVFIATLIAMKWFFAVTNKSNKETIFEKLKRHYRQDIEALQTEGNQKWDWIKIKRIGTLGALFGLVVGFGLSGFDFIKIESYITALVMAGIGFYIPKFVLLVLHKQRIKKLEMQLPDALELVVGSMKAGLSLAQTLDVVSQEAPEPFAQEMQLVVRDCRLGLSPEESLEKMLLRWPNTDFELFVTAASVSLRTGGNLADVASRLIETVRERFRLRGRIETLTAQGKLSGWVVGLLPIFLLIVLVYIEPDMMGTFFKSTVGIALLGACFILEIIGAFFINKIATINT